jgi:hypothetical protein
VLSTTCTNASPESLSMQHRLDASMPAKFDSRTARHYDERVVGVLAAAVALTWLVLAVVCWIGYELFRQNGRVLLRLEAVEQHQGLTVPNTSGGLPVGSVVHDFELPDLVGGRAVLSQWRGRRLLLIFFDPGCPYSRAMVPDLAAMPVEQASGQPMPVIVTTGAPDENTQLFGAYAFRWPVLLQDDHEVAALFRVDGTPMGYLIDEQGRTASPLAVGGQALLELAGPFQSHPVTHLAPDGAAVPGKGLVNLVTRAEVQSRINRTGLTAGTPAPDFRLPKLGGVAPHGTGVRLPAALAAAGPAWVGGRGAWERPRPAVVRGSAGGRGGSRRDP